MSVHRPTVGKLSKLHASPCQNRLLGTCKIIVGLTSPAREAIRDEEFRNLVTDESRNIDAWKIDLSAADGVTLASTCPKLSFCQVLRQTIGKLLHCETF